MLNTTKRNIQQYSAHTVHNSEYHTTNGSKQKIQTTARPKLHSNTIQTANLPNSFQITKNTESPAFGKYWSKPAFTQESGITS